MAYKKQFYCQYLRVLAVTIVIISSILMIIQYSSETKDCSEDSEGIKHEIKYRIMGPLEADDEKLIQILRSKYINGPSTKPYNFSKDISYIITKHKYSWSYIYYFTKKPFQNQTGGFFIEAGALDGEYLSNSLWLEKELNWTGLLIEPDPYNYKELLTKNRKAWTSNTCLSSKSYPKQTIMISLRRTSSLIAQRKWVYRGSSYEVGYTFPPTFDKFLASSTPTYVRVQCFPLYSYLLALNRTKVDLISLDIQGPEMEVIQTFPFDKIQVRAFVVEHTTTTVYDKEFVQYFQDKGYKLIGCGVEPDYIFILRSEFNEHTFEEVTHCIGE